MGRGVINPTASSGILRLIGANLVRLLNILFQAKKQGDTNAALYKMPRFNCGLNQARQAHHRKMPQEFWQVFQSWMYGLKQTLYS